MKNSRGFIQIIVIILVVLAIIAGVYYFGTKNKSLPAPVSVVQPSSSPVVNPTSDPTVNWKMYTNTKYDFSVKYPTDYTLHDEGSNYVEQQIENGQQISGTQPAILDTITFSNQTKNQFSINVFPKTPNANIYNIYEFSGVCGTQFADKTISNKISVLNAIPYKRVQQSLPDGKIMTDICLYNPKDNLITLRSPDSSTTDLLDQVLSTFKFVGVPQLGEACGGTENTMCGPGLACKLNVVGNPLKGGICVSESETNP